jgi:hypothetical protein
MEKTEEESVIVNAAENPKNRGINPKAFSTKAAEKQAKLGSRGMGGKKRHA